MKEIVRYPNVSYGHGYGQYVTFDRDPNLIDPDQRNLRQKYKNCAVDKVPPAPPITRGLSRNASFVDLGNSKEDSTKPDNRKTSPIIIYVKSSEPENTSTQVNISVPSISYVIRPSTDSQTTTKSDGSASYVIDIRPRADSKKTNESDGSASDVTNARTSADSQKSRDSRGSRFLSLLNNNNRIKKNERSCVPF